MPWTQYPRLTRAEHEVSKMADGTMVYCATKYGRDQLKLIARKMGRKLKIVMAPPRVEGARLVLSNVSRPRTWEENWTDDGDAA